METGNKKYAVLVCAAEDSEYMKEKYGGYFGVYVKMLAEEGEIWREFHVAKGEFPTEDEISEFDGYVISGSCHDAHADDIWICKLMNLLKKLDDMKKKVLGICFGHQILARSLGGKIERSNSGWDIGVTSVNLSSPKLFDSLKLPASLHTIEFHRDEISELPEKAEIIAWSNKTRIEMFRYGDHFLGIQGHPEYNKDILLHLIDLLTQRNLIEDDDVIISAKAKLAAYEPDREAWHKLCSSFLKGRLW